MPSIKKVLANETNVEERLKDFGFYGEIVKSMQVKLRKK